MASSLRFNRGQEAGIDVRLGDIGEAIQETMESYEVHIGTNVLPGSFHRLILYRL
jgi:hypothetical protein